MDFSIIKRHPYATGGAVIVGGFVLYLLLSSSQGGATTSTVASGPTAADLQLAGIQAGVQSQQIQASAATSVAQLQADAANKQTDAQLQASLAQLTAQQNLATIQSQTDQANISAQKDVSLANISAGTAQNKDMLDYIEALTSSQNDVIKTQITSQSQQQIAEDNISLQGYQSQLQYQQAIAAYQTATNMAGISASADVASQQIQSQHDLSQQALGIASATGLNHATTSISSSVLQTIAAALNQPAIGVANASAEGTSAMAGAIGTASMWNGIATLGSTVLKGVFA